MVLGDLTPTAAQLRDLATSLDTQCQRISRDGPNFRYRFARIQRCETTNLALSPTLEIELNAVDESGTIWL